VSIHPLLIYHFSFVCGRVEIYYYSNILHIEFVNVNFQTLQKVKDRNFTGEYKTGFVFCTANVNSSKNTLVPPSSGADIFHIHLIL